MLFDRLLGTGNIVAEDGTYFIFKNGNKYGKYKYTKARAIKAERTLVNCTNCIDCEYCEDCHGCHWCTYCYGCENCVSLHASEECIACHEGKELRYSKSCTECENSEHLYRCLNVKDSRNVLNGIDSKNLENCEHIYYCFDLKDSIFCMSCNTAEGIIFGDKYWGNNLDQMKEIENSIYCNPVDNYEIDIKDKESINRIIRKYRDKPHKVLKDIKYNSKDYLVDDFYTSVIEGLIKDGYEIRYKDALRIYSACFIGINVIGRVFCEIDKKKRDKFIFRYDGLLEEYEYEFIIKNYSEFRNNFLHGMVTFYSDEYKKYNISEEEYDEQIDYLYRYRFSEEWTTAIITMKYIYLLILGYIFYKLDHKELNGGIFEW